jgi:hypothetical protein
LIDAIAFQDVSQLAAIESVVAGFVAWVVLDQPVTLMAS